jgi:hypothetical protein
MVTLMLTNGRPCWRCELPKNMTGVNNNNPNLSFITGDCSIELLVNIIVLLFEILTTDVIDIYVMKGINHHGLHQ